MHVFAYIYQDKKKKKKLGQGKIQRTMANGSQGD